MATTAPSTETPISRVAAAPLLELRGIGKAFGAVVALEGVDFMVSPGEVMALVGDNGAGKSTLIKIISGVIPADSGEILVEGRVVRYTGPETPKALGIETVYQELALVGAFDTIQNIYLGREIRRFGGLLLDHGAMQRDARHHLSMLNVNLPSVRKKVRYLSGGQRQAVAISRATGWGAKLVIMDEPTAALGVRESREVLDLVHRLRDAGVGLVLISHNIEHVFQVSDGVTVMRRGRVAARLRTQQTTPDEVVRYITGAAVSEAAAGQSAS